MSESLKKELESTFEGLLVNVLEDARLVITTPQENTLSILSFLKNKGYDHLALISCVDWIEEKELELVYIITSYPPKNDEHANNEKLHICLKTRISRENPEFKTATSVFKNAQPYERELHELFGINFKGNERLTPLFLERDYKIPPFRKDFDTRKYVKEVFDSIPLVDE